jgi:hypothetical protein
MKTIKALSLALGVAFGTQGWLATESMATPLPAKSTLTLNALVLQVQDDKTGNPPIYLPPRNRSGTDQAPRMRRDMERPRSMKREREVRRPVYDEQTTTTTRRDRYADSDRRTRDGDRRWSYERKRHGDRYRHSNNNFRFYYGGWYYNSPFWLNYGYGPSITVYLSPWTPEWYDWCSRRYRSFDPRTGLYFTGSRYVMCRYTGY